MKMLSRSAGHSPASCFGSLVLMTTLILLQSLVVTGQPQSTTPSSAQALSLVQNTQFNYTGSSTYNNTPTIALDGVLNGDYVLTLDPSFSVSGTRLKVKITFPYTASTTGSGCKTYYNGTGCTSTTTNNVADVDMAALGSSLTFSASSAISFQQISNTTTTYYIEYDFGIVSLNNTNPSVPKMMTFSYSGALLNSSQYTGKILFDFSAEFTVTSASGAVYSNTSLQQVILKRPILQVDYSASPSVLSAGTTATFIIDVRHAHESTATPASNLLISLSMSSTPTLTYNNDAQKSQNGGSATSVGSLSNVMGSTVNLGTSDSISITFTITASNLPQLNQHGGALVELSYQGLNTNGTAVQFVESFSVFAGTPSLDLTPGSGDTDLGTYLPVDSTITIQRSISMPQGILNSFAFTLFIETTDGNLNPIPVTPQSSTLTYPSSSVTFSDASLINVGSGGFSNVNSRRRKRQATKSLTSTRNMGSITNAGPANATLQLTVTLVVTGSTPGTLTTAGAYLTVNGNNIYLSSSTPAYISKPVLTLSKTAQVSDASYTPDLMQFSLSAAHSVLSNGPAYDVKLYGGNANFDVYWTTDYSGPALSSLAITNDRTFVWSESLLAFGSSMSMVYKADASSKQSDIPVGISWLNATLTYKASSSGSTTYTVTGGCCIDAKDIGSTSLFYNHGFTIMALIFGIILGLLIILLVMFILVKVLRKAPFNNCNCSCCSCCPGSCTSCICDDTDVESQSHALAVDGGLVVNTKVAVTRGFYRAKDVQKSLQVTIGESIVGILRQTDKFKIHRELDNRDIENTIFVDTQIEEERDSAMAEATINLLKGLNANGDIPNDVMERSLKKFKKGLSDLEKDNEQSFRNELGSIYDSLSKKNKEKLADLLAKHAEEDEEMLENTKAMDPKERDEMKKLMKKKHETEKNELTNLLKLQQDVLSEKARKEFSVRKRMGIKDLQQETIDQIKKDAKLTDQQADWLMKEYLKNQAAVEKLYDDEISRQRMVLEEKLAKRRALATKTEAQEEHQTELLNTLATQQMQAINKAKKEKVLSPDEAEAMIADAQDEMMAVKKKMDFDRMQQEDSLQQKLSERKRKRLEVLAKKHEQEKAEMEKKHKSMQTDGYVDPLTMLEEEQNMISIQRQELTSIENEIDTEHADELLKLREETAEATRKELEKSKDHVITKLKDEGMTEDQADKILNKHKRDMEKLEQTQLEEKERQDEEFKKTLAKRRREWASRREDEKKEQEQLREHEEEVTRKLMDNQVAMSEDERERIMKEHEKQMVKLENSLTLQKLQQKRLLEERLFKKRAQQMEKLQKKQEQETKKVTKQLDNDSDIDDDERHQQEMEMMKKHAEQKIAVMKGEKIELEDEMDAVRDEMLKERASLIQEQEVKLGAMLAALQMEKAKEMARIEEQQKAIHDLKANLMDDLNDKGILSDPKCQQVIEMHRKEQEKLQSTLDAQRARQEKRFKSVLQKRLMEKEELLQHQQKIEINELEDEDEALRKRLQDRLRQKEQNLANMQEQQLKEAGADGISPAARIRRVALKHKHMMEMEQFRNRMEKEISQTLEDVRRQNDMQRIKDLQEQELQFINGLVRLGAFKMEELEEVVTMLFPLKSDQQRQEMLSTLTEGYKPRQDRDYDETDGPQNDGSLVERVKSARYERARSASIRSARGNNKGRKNKKDRDNISRRLERRRASQRDRSPSPNYYSDDEYSEKRRTKLSAKDKKLGRRGR